MPSVEITSAILCVIVVTIAAEIYWKKAIKSDLTGKSAKIVLSILTITYYLLAMIFHQIDFVATTAVGLFYLIVIYPYRSRKILKKIEEEKVDKES